MQIERAWLAGCKGIGDVGQRADDARSDAAASVSSSRTAGVVRPDSCRGIDEFVGSPSAAAGIANVLHRPDSGALGIVVSGISTSRVAVAVGICRDSDA